MKHSKKKSFVSRRFIPLTLVALLVISMVTIAFAANISADAAEYVLKDVPVAKESESTAHWVDATYFDYLSDKEMENDGANWLEPIKAGTNYDGSEDNWYPYDTFNQKISDNSRGWTNPLYLGNFCNNFDSYTPAEKTHGGPYSVKSQLNGFNYFANNSNGLSDYHTAVKNLVGNKLDSSGNLLTDGQTAMPYFNKSFLTSNKMAKVFNSKFPFTQEKIGPDVTKYEFNSTDGQDNVYFNWSGSDKKTPTSVAYGAGSNYAVNDGLNYFVNGMRSGKGVFPFNRADGDGGSTNLDYGFGIRMDMDFKVPKDGLAVMDDGTKEPVYFDYSGDDDLWVYISEAGDNEAKLVLDLGGDHKMAHGRIDFSTMTTKVDQYVDITKVDEHCAEGLMLYDNLGWGSNMRVYAYNSAGASAWFKPERDARAGEDAIANNSYSKVYNIPKDQKSVDGQHTLSEMDRFIVTKNQAASDSDWSNVTKAPAGRTIFVKDTKGWGSDMRLWAWKDGDTSGEFGGEWFEFEDLGDSIYAIRQDAVGSKGHKLIGDGLTDFKLAKGNWDAQISNDVNLWDTSNHLFDNSTETASREEKLYEPKVSDRLNMMTYTDNIAYDSNEDDVIPWAYEEGQEESFTIESKTSSAAKKTVSTGADTLDPTKLYHMTIFYMERGMLESNCRMAFTMTPAQNFLEVTNQVNLTDLNPALVDPIKDNEKFDFKSTNTQDNGGVIEDTDPSYTDTINDPDPDPSYEHNGKERYDNKFRTGSDLHVSQTEDTILKYDTTWNVVDKADNDKVIKEYDKDDNTQDSKNTDLFTLINKDPIEDADMQVNFINTPQVNNVVFNKDVFNQSGDDKNSNENFTFKMNLKINGLDSNTFPLTYYLIDEIKEGSEGTNADYDTAGFTAYTMANDGTFTVPADRAVLIKGLPLDAEYTITETNSGDYINKTGSVTGKVGTDFFKFFRNEEEATQPPSTTAPPTETETETETETQTQTETVTETETETETQTQTETETETETQTQTETVTETETETVTETQTQTETVTETQTETETVTETETQTETVTETVQPVTSTEPPVENEPEIKKIIDDSKYTPYYTTAAIGETVKFKLTGTVTGSTVNKLKAYTIVDTMSEGLTFGKVTAVSLTGNKTLKLQSSQWKATKTDDGFEVSIDSSVLGKDAFYSYKNVVVDCTAKLNKDAVIGPDGNPNEDSLKWTTADGEEHEKEGNEVVVYTFQIDVNKIDAATKDAVEGCSFELYSSASDAKKGENAIAKATSDDEGLASFIGLDGGKYFVKETKAAKGYNLNSKVYTVNIKPKFNKNGGLTGPEDGIVNTTIENTKPQPIQTGGYAGTIWFGAIGAGFLAAAGIILFFAFRKKSSAK